MTPISPRLLEQLQEAASAAAPPSEPAPAAPVPQEPHILTVSPAAPAEPRAQAVANAIRREQAESPGPSPGIEPSDLSIQSTEVAALPGSALSLATRLMHPLHENEDAFAATAPPLYQTATFRQRSAVECGPYDYTRSGNPTRTQLESHMADIEVCRLTAS